MASRPLSTLIAFVLQVLGFSLLVGLALSWLGINPKALLLGGWQAVLAAPAAAIDAIGWTVPYILTGAIIVVPVMGIGLVLRSIGRARPRERQGERENDTGR